MLKKIPEQRTRYRTKAPINLASNLMSIQPDSETEFDDTFFQRNLPQYYRVVLKEFRRTTHSFVTFNLLFGCLFFIEIALFFSSLPFLSKSALFAFALGGIFLTGFTYFVLLFYYQAKKPEQLCALKNQFLQSCRQALPIPPGEAQHHLSLAEALSKLANYLEDFEKRFYTVPTIFSFLSSAISRFSTHCYGKDVFKMKELLLEDAVEEHLKQIRNTPTDLEVHASLANTYVYLSKLYKSAHLNDPFTKMAHLAMEEFSILSQYAPNDPWVHEQLAAGYRDLGMVEEEIREVETLLQLRAQDKEILYRLGSLYFAQGRNAKGLQVYDELKKANFKKAEDLVASYGTSKK